MAVSWNVAFSTTCANHENYNIQIQSLKSCMWQKQQHLHIRVNWKLPINNAEHAKRQE